MSRRDIFVKGAAFGLCSYCASASASNSTIASCTLPPQDRNIGLDRAISGFAYKEGGGKLGSGDPDFDQALAATLVRLSDMFDVLPGFGFAEASGFNAFATTEKKIGARQDGSVVFGLPLLRGILQRPENPHVGIASVCAHEFAHIAQYKRGLRSRLVGDDGRVKHLELHADFLTGYFAGRRKLETPHFPAAIFASTLYSFGDNAYGAPQHHGTEEERGTAVVAGFKTAFDKRESFENAIEIGIGYVMGA